MAEPRSFPFRHGAERRQGATNQETWTSFRHVCYALRKYKADGIGFVFTADDPFCGVDLDKCQDANGGLNPRALKTVHRLNSYTELSPSGGGLHVIVKAAITGSGRRNAAIEVYSAGRYFTITGKRLPSTPEEVEPRQAELDALMSELFAKADQNECQSKVAAPFKSRSDVETTDICTDLDEGASNPAQLVRVLRQPTMAVLQSGQRSESGQAETQTKGAVHRR